ncbi:MAG: hypothetical protein J7M25_14510 [Deltaproteobacteria bacterium]|nr:hypothetical protein [Deltaproteobacteria bacterium]
MTWRSAFLVSVVTAGLWWSSGCKQTQVNTPERNLERPTVLAQFCAGPTEPGGENLTALPPEYCSLSGAWCNGDEDACKDALDERALFALVLNSARGELSLADLTHGRLVDLAAHQIGYGMVPTGPAPVDLKTTSDGCAAYVLNGGSCDFSVVDDTGLLRLAGWKTARTSQVPLIGRTGFFTDSGRLLARPGEMEIVPGPMSDHPICKDIQGYQAFVTFPSCGLVARVDLDTGRVLQSLFVSDQGVVDGGTDPFCPADCADVHGDGHSGGNRRSDAPGHLAFVDYGQTGRSSRLLVAADRAGYIVSIDVAPEGVLQTVGASVITFDDVDDGIRRIRLVGPTPVHDWFFLYVMTRQGDVRVLDLDADVECETNPDSRDPFFGQESWLDDAGCIPLGAVPRAPLSDSPGIELPGHRQVVDAVFVYNAQSDLDDSLDELDPMRLGGSFVYLLTLDGEVFLVDVDEEFATTDENHNGTSDEWEHRRQDGVYAIMAHQIRNLTDTREAEDGRVRVDDPIFYLKAGELWPDPPGNMDISGLDVTDPKVAVNETWTLDYEGVLPAGTGAAGYVYKPVPAMDDPDSAELRDDSMAFCPAGVRVGDLVVIKGCEDDSDCLDGYSCLANTRQNQDNGGLCIDSRYIGQERVLNACMSLAQGSREYEVKEAHNHRLVLGVLDAPGTACQTAADCGSEGGTSGSFVCDHGRCSLDCSTDEDVCATVAGVCQDGLCVRAPLPDRRVDLGGEVTWCMPSFIGYEIRVMGQFLVYGSVTGTLVSGVPDATQDDTCIPDPTKPPLYRARLPLDAKDFSNPILTFAIQGGSATSPPGRDDGFQFDVISGFTTAALDASMRIPASALWGMDGMVYLLDMGDDTETQGGVTGQVLRLDSVVFAMDTDFVLR